MPSAGTSSTSFVHNLKPTRMLLSHLTAVAYLIACSFLHQTLRHNSNAWVIVGWQCYFITFWNFRICHFFILLSLPLKVWVTRTFTHGTDPTSPRASPGHTMASIHQEIQEIAWKQMSLSVGRGKWKHTFARQYLSCGLCTIVGADGGGPETGTLDSI